MENALHRPPVHGGGDGLAHGRRGDLFLARLHDVGGAQAGGEHVLDRAFDEGRVLVQVEGIAQRHGEAEHAGQGIGQPLAGDVRGAAVDRFVKGLAAAGRILRPQGHEC